MRQLKISNSFTDRESITLDKYLNDVSREGMISQEEEVELTKRIREGDDIALDRMVRANLRFVVSVAKQYQGQGMPLIDMISEGNLGLIKAAKRFDEKRGFKFISYAVWWIRQSIMSAIAEYSRTVRIPLNQANSIRKIKYASRQLEQSLERLPTTYELAEQLDFTPENVQFSQESSQYGLSLDAPVGDDMDSVTIGDRIEGDLLYSTEVLVDQSSLRTEVRRILDTLEPMERTIISNYFGLENDERSLSDIADELQLSKERIRQIKKKALKRLSSSIHIDMMAYINWAINKRLTFYFLWNYL